MPVSTSSSSESPARLRPHAPLPDYYADEESRRAFLRRIFDETAVDYERIERLLSLGSGSWYRRQALLRAGLRPGMAVLDVGIGTGLLARQALHILGGGASLVGVDPSPGMMAEARLPGIRLLEGRAESLPVADASADFIMMGYALRHIDDVDAALAEFRRVLRPGGRLLILEITRPQRRLAQGLLKAYMRVFVPISAKLIARRTDTTRLWRYYWDTIDACIAPQALLQALRRAGYQSASHSVQMGIFSEFTAQTEAAACSPDEPSA